MNYELFIFTLDTRVHLLPENGVRDKTHAPNDVQKKKYYQ